MNFEIDSSDFNFEEDIDNSGSTIFFILIVLICAAGLGVYLYLNADSFDFDYEEESKKFLEGVVDSNSENADEVRKQFEMFEKINEDTKKICREKNIPKNECNNSDLVKFCQENIRSTKLDNGKIGLEFIGNYPPYKKPLTTSGVFTGSGLFCTLALKTAFTKDKDTLRAAVTSVIEEVEKELLTPIKFSNISVNHAVENGWKNGTEKFIFFDGINEYIFNDCDDDDDDCTINIPGNKTHLEMLTMFNKGTWTSPGDNFETESLSLEYNYEYYKITEINFIDPKIFFQEINKAGFIKEEAKKLIKEKYIVAKWIYTDQKVKLYKKYNYNEPIESIKDLKYVSPTIEDILTDFGNINRKFRNKNYYASRELSVPQIPVV